MGCKRLSAYWTGNGSGIYFNTSKDNGKTFTSRDSVSGKAAKHCQIATLPDDNILIPWNESFPNGSKFSSRIGIEQRDANGKTVTKDYITSETSNSSFPVIYPINPASALIVYTENVKEKDYISFKKVSLR